MQVFVPYQSPLDCAEAMWADQKRYNKQIVECRQILKAIDGETKTWANHPCTKMYATNKKWLEYYLLCLMEYRNSIKSEDNVEKNCFMAWAEHYNEKANDITPSFLSSDFCNQHKRRLFTKAPDLYPQFFEYGTSEVNWYFVDGKILKYKDGRRIKETD